MLRGIVQLLDARRDPSEDDLQMLEFLSEIGAPTIIAATKIDKLTAKERRERLSELTGALELDDDQVIPFSSVTGEGRDELASAIVSLLEGESWR